jgi:hypothetical protein
MQASRATPAMLVRGCVRAESLVDAMGSVGKAGSEGEKGEQG